MMKLLPFFLFLAFTTPDFQAQSPYLPVPAGWRVEQFPFPIEFAPQIPYSGDEHLRFAPTWDKLDSDESWAYCFLWWIKLDSKMRSESLEKDLQAYYAGLVGRNITRRKIDQSLVVPTITEFKETVTEKGDNKTYVGTIKMLDYMSLRPVTLHVRVYQMLCTKENKMAVFFAVSPQPQSHAIWGQFKMVREGFQCSK